jgi:hypothetical protein
MASYLSTATVGDFALSHDAGPHGLPIINAIDSGVTGAALAQTKASLALQPKMIAFLEGLFRRYPFEAFGAIVDDDSVDYALETRCGQSTHRLRTNTRWCTNSGTNGSATP